MRTTAWQGPQGTGAVGLRVLSLLIGTFVFFMGVDKIAWFTNPDLLLDDWIYGWLERAPRASRWYLETIVIPGAPIFARVVPLAELAAGAALVLGIRVRLAAALTLLMIVNFHFAADVLFHYRYLTNPYGLPMMGGLLALAIGGARLPFSVSR